MKASTKKRIAGERAEEAVMEILKEAGYERFAGNFLYSFESSVQHSSHQIDVLVVTQKHLFIIEVKHYRHILEWDLSKDTWVLEFHKTGEKQRRRNGIDNPIMQNRNHRYVLIKNLTTVAADQVIAVSVVLSETDILNGEKWKQVAPCEYIVGPEQLVELLWNIDCRCQDLMDIDSVAEELVNLPTAQIGKHLAYLKKVEEIKQISKRNKVYDDLSQKIFEIKVCQRCGSRMYIRCKGTSLFWGCGSYPVCTTTKRWEDN